MNLPNFFNKHITKFATTVVTSFLTFVIIIALAYFTASNGGLITENINFFKLAYNYSPVLFVLSGIIFIFSTIVSMAIVTKIEIDSMKKLDRKLNKIMMNPKF